MENTSATENEKQRLSNQLAQAEVKYQEINKQLKIVEEKMMLARENKARSGATLEGLENRKKDLLSRIKNSYKRPIAFYSNDQELKELIEKRKKIYSEADFEINCNKLSKAEIVNKIIILYEDN